MQINDQLSGASRPSHSPGVWSPTGVRLVNQIRGFCPSMGSSLPLTSRSCGAALPSSRVMLNYGLSEMVRAL